MNELELKSTGRKCEVKMNGEDLRCVTEITIHVVAGEYPVVTIVQDSDVHISGVLVDENIVSPHFNLVKKTQTELDDQYQSEFNSEVVKTLKKQERLNEITQATIHQHGVSIRNLLIASITTGATIIIVLVTLLLT